MFLTVLSTVSAQTPIFKDKFDQTIKVLNFGTFHMRYTDDATSVEFDENDAKNKAEVHKIAQLLAKFKPTVIIVETSPSYNPTLQKAYQAYLQNPKMEIKDPNEIELLAFELGRLAQTQRIFGIDHKMGYNYGIGYELAATKVNDATYENYMNLATAEEKKINFDQLPVFEQLKMTNHPQYLDFLINVNADMLAYVSTEQKFEGADEAAKFYQRNLRMYSNLNQIDLKPTDRLFILMGAAHTAFFNDFMKRSPKYELVNPFMYLK
jgi:hypothetical protein